MKNAREIATAIRTEFGANVDYRVPAYSDIAVSLADARADANEYEPIVCLIPARTDTRWWFDNCWHGEVRFLRGRLRFDAAGKSGAPFPSAVVIFGREPKVIWWDDFGNRPRLPGIRDDIVMSVELVEQEGRCWAICRPV